MELVRRADMESIIRRFEKRLVISRFAVEWLYKLVKDKVIEDSDTEKTAVQFSVVELLNQVKANATVSFGRTG